MKPAQQPKPDYFPAGDDVGALVLDLGRGSVRFGYAGEDCPKQLWPSYVGKRVQRGEDVEMGGAESRIFPLNFYQKCEDLEVEPCVRYQDGQLRLNTDAFGTLVEKISGPSVGLNVSLEGKPVLLTEPSRHSREFRTKMTEHMFEAVQCEALYIAKSAPLSTFAVGRTSGCVVDVGAGGTAVTPVIDGFTLQRNISEYPIGGDLMDKHFAMLLSQANIQITPTYAYSRVVPDVERGVVASTPVDLSKVHPTYLKHSKDCVIRGIKESACRCSDVPIDSTAASNLMNASTAGGTASKLELPDGTFLPDLEPAGIMTSELLFNPQGLLTWCSPQSLNGFEGLPKAIFSNIVGCDLFIRREMFNCVIFNGGVSLIPGAADRLSRSLQEGPVSASTKVKVVAPSNADRKFNSWIGGSILASLATFQQMWLSKAEYEEHGSMLVERKCRH